MQDYTPEGMLKRIEILEKVADIHQQTIDNLITFLEDAKGKITRVEATLDIHNDRIGNLEHPDN